MMMFTVLGVIFLGLFLAPLFPVTVPRLRRRGR